MSSQNKSGLYETMFSQFHFELRLDVDGSFSQNQVSVTLTNQFPSHWIANLSVRSPASWEGSIWFRNGSADDVTISGLRPNRFRIEWSETSNSESVQLTFLRDFQSLLTITLERESEFFHEVEFEIDHQLGVDVLTEYDTHAHPRRPSDLPHETLTLTEAFARAGVNVSVTDGGNVFDASRAGADAEWARSELNDAMMANWSRPDGTPWSMWVMAASKFDDEPGSVVFGIMFDSIGNFHRNGTAVFNTSIENFYPSGTPNRAATIQRHKFRTLAHEIGHAFNLAHSWQKEIRQPWHPGVSNEVEARSFMNYPGRVQGGENAYWNDFRFRFSSQELQFMRHAPADFVAMGGEDWLQNHADVAVDPEAPVINNGLALHLRVQRKQPIFDYLEPVRIELKLENTTKKPISVPSEILNDMAKMKIYVTRRGGDTTQVRPYAVECFAPTEDHTLNAGKSLYGEVYLSSASNGWLISEPGQYEVVIGVNSICQCESSQRDNLATGRMVLYVRPPAAHERMDYEQVAQDYFSEEVGRVLSFGGSRLLEKANNYLKGLSERLPECQASIHAQLALHMPDTRAYKLVSCRDKGLDLKVLDSRIEEVESSLKQLLVNDGARAAQTLGHLEFKSISDRYTRALERVEEGGKAASMQKNVLTVLKKCKAKLPKTVRDEIKKRIEGLTK